MTEKSLSGRVAVVTGSSRGIGRGIAIGLGEAGATVYVTGRSTGDGPLTIDTTAKMVTEAGGVGVAAETDFFDDSQIEALYQRIVETGLRLLGRAGLSREDVAGLPSGRIVGRALSSLSLTIAAGTSQIQRNIISERILGLPREPRPEAARG